MYIAQPKQNKKKNKNIFYKGKHILAAQKRDVTEFRATEAWIIT